MKKKLNYSLLLIALITFFAACGQKNGADSINDLVKFVKEVQVHGQEYTPEQWTESRNNFDKLMAPINEMYGQMDEDQQKTVSEYTEAYNNIFLAHNPQPAVDQVLVEPLVEGEDISNLFE